MKRSLQIFARGAAGMVCLSWLTLSLASCVSNEHSSGPGSALAKAKATAALAALQPTLYNWHDDVASGKPVIRIVLNEQKAYIFRGAQQAGWTYLASGVSTHNTPTGTFTILEKLAQKRSNTYGVIENSAGQVVNWDAKSGRDRIPPGGRFVGAPMPYWMRLTSYGVGMHAGPIPRPGLPASHGCIRLPEAMAKKLFEIVEVGTPVTIIGHAPDPHAVATNAMVASRRGGAE